MRKTLLIAIGAIHCLCCVAFAEDIKSAVEKSYSDNGILINEINVRHSQEEGLAKIYAEKTQHWYYESSPLEIEELVRIDNKEDIYKWYTKNVQWLVERSYKEGIFMGSIDPLLQIYKSRHRKKHKQSKAEKQFELGIWLMVEGKKTDGLMALNRVVTKYPESQYAEKALFTIIDHYRGVNFDKLKEYVYKYRELFPQSENLEKVNSIFAIDENNRNKNPMEGEKIEGRHILPASSTPPSENFENIKNRNERIEQDEKNVERIIEEMLRYEKERSNRKGY